MLGWSSPDGKEIAIQEPGTENKLSSISFFNFHSGKIEPLVNPQTIADGLRATLGQKPFAEIRRHVDDIVTVSEEAIVSGMRNIWEVLKIVVEPERRSPEYL